MAPLNIHAEESVAPKRKKNKTLKILLGVAALIAIPVIGTTLAATITINSSDGNVQFGQGTITTAACDTGLNLSTTSAYSNDFLVKTITISNIDLTTGCEGKTLTISAAIPAASPSPSVEGELLSGVTQISFTIPATVGSTSTLVTGLPNGVTADLGMLNASGTAYKTATIYDNTGQITLTITTPTFLSSNVSKFLIQSS